MLQILMIFQLLCSCFDRSSGQSPQDVEQVSQIVRRYLTLEGRSGTSDYPGWLENSGKIGSGFDTVAGSPVCYSATCQMEGFRRQLFKLKFTQPPEGSCTKKLIPENVDLDCLSSLQMTANTESITTLE